MRKVLPTAVAVCWLGAAALAAEGPDVSQVLALKPVQQGIVYDTPGKDAWDQCKLDVLTGSTSGWVLRDARGLVVRRFLDTNKDNTVDQWSYFMNGQEVYRDIDSNGNGKADEYRWFNAGGSRWGIDANEDRRVDRWKQLSAEEAAQEAIAALASKDVDRLRTVLVDADDVRTLGLTGDSQDRISKSIGEAAARFQAVSRQLPANLEFSRFDGHNPMAVPGSDAGASDDLMIYQNASIITDVNQKSYIFRVAEVVRVGNVWKLTEAPVLLDPERPAEFTGVLIPAVETGPAVAATHTGDDEGKVENNDEVRQFVATLQKHDEGLPANANDPQAMAQFHTKRAELCAHIGSKSRKLENREYWYQQTADSLNAAVQTGSFPQGIQTLRQYAEQFSKVNWGKNLAAYYLYRAINSDYALKLAQPNNDHAKAQEAFLTELQNFLTQFPEASDRPEALLQLGNGTEFAGKADDAKRFYQEIVSQYPKSNASAKAAGALRRIDAVGQPFQLVGRSLLAQGSIDTTRYEGRVLVVNYWATWCEPCKAELPRLKQLREKYAQQGLEIVGVCLDSDPQAAQTFLQRGGYNWPQIFEQGSMDSKVAVQYGVISLPFVVVVDAEGRVLDRNVDFNQLESVIEKALAKKVATNKR